MNVKTFQLNQALRIARLAYRRDSTWRHYKGGVYSVIGVCFDANADEVAISYKRIDGPDFDIFAEDYIEFTRTVSDWNKPTADGQPRFVEVRKVTTEEWVPRS